MTAAPAEIVRTLTAHRPAHLHLLHTDDTATPLSFTDPCGNPVLLLADNSPIIAALDGKAGVALRYDDRAPVPGAPILGSAWLCGWAAPVTRFRRLAIKFAAVHPVPELLDLGHGHRLWRVTPEEVALEQGELSQVPVGEYTAARPDDWYGLETDLVMDLRVHHPEVLDALLRRIRRRLPAARHVTPLRMDRHGTTVDVDCGDEGTRRFLVRHRPGVNAPGDVLHSLAGCGCHPARPDSAAQAA
ncbi:hypothetical protein LX16_0012 [Stackebrandtia albiflava]|uniref:DUF2470 domain-containing protein n=1 Tax=Stackebrandtia albiflava TaxID=406432 RepID=A0A562VH23_9ACTN|nr:hypothetical protein [Stackebrandtia albiflava]TWJ17097.1 hypothetical protein LX16_0012 [Stackebrandtia albiflava]